jgi:predicted O-methyltransferase YrrM
MKLSLGAKERFRARFFKGSNEAAATSLEDELEKAQAAWRKVMAAYANHLGVVEMPDYPILEARHLSHCKVFPLRQAILERMPKHGKVAELGVQEGLFSEDILAICQPSELHLVDIDLTTFKVAERFSEQVGRGVVTLHEKDSATAISGFPDGHFDFIYIDADHSYEAVKRDIEASVPKVRVGGYLLFNDYTFWSPAECMPYGIMQAVNELCIAEDWEIVYFAFGHMGYGDVALRRIADAGDRP